MIRITFKGDSREAIERQIRDFVGLSAASIAGGTFTPKELADDRRPIGHLVCSDEVRGIAEFFKVNLTEEGASMFGRQPLPDGAFPPLPDAAAIAVAAPSATAPAAASGSSAPPLPAASSHAAASAPVPPAASPAPAGTVKIDSAGLPWDERIHASTRALIADGTWRKKRNVNLNYCSAIEAQLRAEAGLPAPAPPAPPAPPAAAVSTVTTFADAIRRIGPKMQDGTIAQAKLVETLGRYGMAGLHELNNKPAHTLEFILAELGV